MLILTKSVMSMMIGFITSVLMALLLIPILRRHKANQSISEYLRETHRKKVGTPTMGGLIFILPTCLITILFLLLGKLEMNYTILIVFITFIGYGLIGYLDDYLIIKRHNNQGLSETSKLIMQFILAVFFFYFFMRAGHEPLLWIHTLNFKVHIGWFYGVFILFILVASSNAVNLTDGLDGLAGGLSVIAFLAFGLISWNTGWLEGYEELAIFAFTLIGSILGFLVFNVHPAKIFMGDTGSLALGGLLGTYAILTRHELLLVMIGIVFVLETLSSLLQRVYYKITKKRLFPMAPLHHTFEKMGMKEQDIVKIFWILGLLGAMVSIAFGVWL